MIVNKITQTPFNGKLKFIKPEDWNDEIFSACEESNALNDIAKKSNKDLWLDLSTKKIGYNYRYKIHASLSNSMFAHIFKRITGINTAQLSRRHHRASTVVEDVIPSLDFNSTRKAGIVNKLLDIKI